MQQSFSRSANETGCFASVPSLWKITPVCLVNALNFTGWSQDDYTLHMVAGENILKESLH